MVMAIVDSAAVLFIQWGTYTEPTYTAPSTVDETTRLLNSIRGQLTRFVAQMWMEQKYIWLLNFCVLGMVYLVLIFVLNRFWVATALFAIITSVFAVANHIKIQLRNGTGHSLGFELHFQRQRRRSRIIYPQRQPGISKQHHHHARLAYDCMPAASIY